MIKSSSMNTSQTPNKVNQHNKSKSMIGAGTTGFQSKLRQPSSKLPVPSASATQLVVEEEDEDVGDDKVVA